MDQQLHIRSPRTVGDFITIGEVSLCRQIKNFWTAVAVTCRSMCNQFRGWLLLCALKLWNSCNIRLGKHCNMYNMLTLFSRQSCIRLVTMDVAHFICGSIICWEQDIMQRFICLEQFWDFSVEMSQYCLLEVLEACYGHCRQAVYRD